VEGIARDFESAGLEERHVAMLRYAAKLTDAPRTMVREDVETLREAGWSDAAILAMAEVAGYYAYVNRLVAGLGVELED